MNMKTVTLDNGRTVSYDASMPTVDDGLAFYQSQLAYLEPRWYETKYPGIDYPELVPVNTSLPEWVNEVNWRMYDGVTMGKFIGANADDLPRVAISAKMFKAPIEYAGNEFEYSLNEMRVAAAMNLPLDTSMAALARRGAEEHTQRVVYFGDAERNMTGLFNNPNVPTDNSTLDWFDPATDPMDIVEEINDQINSVFEITKGVSLPDTLVLPSKRWTFVNQTYASKLAPSRDNTILALIKQNNVHTQRTGGELRIVPRFQLNQEELPKYIPGYNDGDIMMVYERLPDNLETHIPMPWRPIAPQPRGLKIVVPAEYKASGTQFRYPLTAAYRKMIKRT